MSVSEDYKILSRELYIAIETGNKAAATTTLGLVHRAQQAKLITDEQAHELATDYQEAFA